MVAPSVQEGLTLSPISHEESVELELETFLGNLSAIGREFLSDLQRVSLLCHPTRKLDFIA